MDPFNEELTPLPLEAVNAQTIAEDLQAWKDDPPDEDFALILEAEPVDD
jgi:hypothetical protein